MATCRVLYAIKSKRSLIREKVIYWNLLSFLCVLKYLQLVIHQHFLILDRVQFRVIENVYKF